MSIYVTDTHALVFFANRNQRVLSRRAWEIFEQAENRQVLILIPAAALWEVSNLERIGRIQLAQSYEEWSLQLFTHPCFDCVPLDAAIMPKRVIAISTTTFSTPQSSPRPKSEACH